MGELFSVVVTSYKIQFLNHTTSTSSMYTLVHMWPAGTLLNSINTRPQSLIQNSTIEAMIEATEKTGNREDFFGPGTHGSIRLRRLGV